MTKGIAKQTNSMTKTENVEHQDLALKEKTQQINTVASQICMQTKTSKLT